jgi:protein-tyrosine-phosphatase
MAEGFARRAIAERGKDWTTSSAGILQSAPLMVADALRAVKEADPSMSAHRSKVLDVEQIRGADLVLGMTREHVREVVVMERDAWPRTFTVKELVRRGDAMGPRHEAQEPAQWLRLAGIGRRRRDLQGASPLDDIEDPMGLPAADGRKIASAIRCAVENLIDLMAPRLPEQGG